MPEVPTATFSVLGPVEAWLDGAPLRLGGPKQRAVLAMLVLDTLVQACRTTSRPVAGDVIGTRGGDGRQRTSPPR